jgi:SAM-dependent methyltransferase
VAREALAGLSNCVFHHAGVGDMPLAPGSMDFGYALGVLHHVPDPLEGLRACTARLKPGAPFLLYLYYKLENRPAWFRALWRASDLLRGVVSRLPPAPRLAISGALALAVYWPLARLARLVERLGGDPGGLPLSWYRRRALYVMRTDAYDRFCTRVEKRFTRTETEAMMRAAGLRDIRFSPGLPYWCAVGYRERTGDASAQ